MAVYTTPINKDNYSGIVNGFTFYRPALNYNENYKLSY
jgi:hypothetical protein